MSFPDVSTGATAGIGLVCIVIAALLWVFNHQRAPRLIVILVLTGTLMLMSTPIGSWLQSTVNNLDAVAAATIGRFTGAIVAGLIAIAVLLILALQFKNRDIGTLSLGLAAGVPLTMHTIPGPVGDFVTSGLNTLASAVGGVIGALFGLG